MQLFIGNKNYSSWSMRPWVLMRHYGIPFDEVMVRFDSFQAGSNFKQRIEQVAPTGRVPVLVDDGLVVWDTLAIAEYLAERFPQHPLWPRGARERARARSLCAEMHAGFSALRNHCPQNIEASLPEIGRRLLHEQAGAAQRPAALAGDVERCAARQRRPVPVWRLRHRRRLLRAGGRPHPHLCVAGRPAAQGYVERVLAAPVWPHVSAMRWRNVTSSRSRSHIARRATAESPTRSGSWCAPCVCCATVRRRVHGRLHPFMSRMGPWSRRGRRQCVMLRCCSMSIRFLLARCLRAVCVVGWLGSAIAAAAPAAPASPSDPINEAREALRKRDGYRLLELRNAALADRHPLAQWVDYWELGNRISEAGTEEVEAFYQRWSGSYVEDRMRNDWLLELGRRRDWVAFVRDYPRFRMNDDREVSCYWLLTEHIAGKRVYEAARALWLAQRDGDDGCTLMGLAGRVQGVPRGRQLDEAAPDVEANRPRVAAPWPR